MQGYGSTSTCLSVYLSITMLAAMCIVCKLKLGHGILNNYLQHGFSQNALFKE